jgi:tetratricopeptide (TPR) repeat protein
LEAALERHIKAGQAQSQLSSWLHRAQLALLMTEPQVALDAANSALDLAEQTATPSRFAYSARSFVWSHWLLGSAHLQLQQLADAETHLDEALTRCRHISLVELEPDILLSWARWHHAQGDREPAREYATEALSIASRSHYRLKEAELYSFLAQLSLDADEVEEARECAAMAKEKAWCDGPPHCFGKVLDEAEGILESLSE